jgi:hypothetical protein
MGGACSTHGRNARRILIENLRGRDQFEEAGVDGRVILK